MIFLYCIVQVFLLYAQRTNFKNQVQFGKNTFTTTFCDSENNEIITKDIDWVVDKKELKNIGLYDNPFTFENYILNHVLFAYIDVPNQQIKWQTIKDTTYLAKMHGPYELMGTQRHFKGVSEVACVLWHVRDGKFEDITPFVAEAPNSLELALCKDLSKQTADINRITKSISVKGKKTFDIYIDCKLYTDWKQDNIRTTNDSKHRN